jgi:hypothetical protein
MATIISQMYYVYTLTNSLTGTVFYVGKGCRCRILRHESDARNGVQSHKCNVIRKIWRDGGSVIKKKIAQFTAEPDAFVYEWCLINLIYGRDNLTNNTDGGEGTSGWHHTPESRQKLDAHLHSPAFREKQLQGARKSKNTKTYAGFISPDGTVYSPVRNLTAFCKEHRLKTTSMCDLVIGKSFQHKGWIRLDPVERTPKKQQPRPYQGTAFQSPDGIVYADIPDFIAFCHTHSLRVNLMLDVEAGVSQSCKGWTCYPPKFPVKTFRSYQFVSPDGVIYGNIPSINAFCREHGLNKGEMMRVYRGIAHSHKGWKRYEP